MNTAINEYRGVGCRIEKKKDVFAQQKGHGVCVFVASAKKKKNSFMRHKWPPSITALSLSKPSRLSYQCTAQRQIGSLRRWPVG